MNSEYKVGDHVRVRSYEAMAREGELREQDMKKYCGKEAMITAVKDNCYILDIDNNYWDWPHSAIEGYAFEYGERIEVGALGGWWPRIYVGYVDGADKPYICVHGETERDFEAFLRDAGWSRREAERVIAVGFRSVLRQRDPATELAETIRKAVRSLQSR